MAVASRLRQLQQSIGRSASMATGADIPRPRPVAEALPSAPAKSAVVFLPRQQLSQAQVNALLRKMQEGQELTLQEMYYLTDAGALPDPSLQQIDNLETSSIELPDTEVVPTKDNLTPNKTRVKETDVDRVYNEINNLANPQEAANPKQVERTLGLLNKVLADPAAKQQLYARFGDAEFADARIGNVRGLAEDGIGRDAAKIDAAAQSRAAAGQPRAVGQPGMRAPGARSVEVSGPALHEADLPSTYDDALARLREQLFETQIRPSNPVTPDEVAGLAATAGVEPGQLPIALRGRLEDRSLSSRGGVSNREESALNALRAAQGRLDASASPEDMARAAEEMANAETLVNRAFGKTPRAKSDAALNRPSQLETARSLFDTIVGARDNPGRRLNRSSVEFSARERDLNAADAQDTLSFDPNDTTPADMMPEGMSAEDMEMLGEGGKRGRLGGRQNQSRRRAAVEQLFSTVFGPGLNPLDKTKFHQFDGDPRKVADYVARTQINTRIEGSPSWELARDEFADAVNEAYGSAGGRPLGIGIGDEKPSVAHLNAPMSTEGPSLTGTSRNAEDIPQEGGRPNNVVNPEPVPSAARIPAGQLVDAGSADAPSVTARARRRAGASARRAPPGPKPLASDVNLASSATELGSVPPAQDPLATAATGNVGASPATGTRAYTPEEIEDAATEAYGMAYQTAKDEGMSNPDAQAVARDAANKVRAEMQASGTRPPADGSTAAPKPEAAAKASPESPPKADGETLDPVADPQAKGGGGSKGGSTKNTEPDADTKPVEEGPSKPANDADGPAPKSDPDPSGKPAPKPEPKKSWLTLPRVLAGLTGAGVIAANMGGGSGGVVAGGPIPVPPGGGGVSAGEDAEAQADAITRALERIRGSRRNDGMPTTQVIQNWTGWR